MCLKRGGKVRGVCYIMLLVLGRSQSDIPELTDVHVGEKKPAQI